MRIISGKYKGRTLVAPKSDTRPTLDRAKETLFNILAPKIPDAVVLDLFGGSGQLALECLSRGCARAILCDNARDAAVAIKSNFEKVGEKPELYQCDYSACLARLNVKVDLVFVDPPYKSGLYLEVLSKLQQYDIVTADGVVVCEHGAEDSLPNSAHGFSVYDERKIGSVKFTFYKRVQ